MLMLDWKPASASEESAQNGTDQGRNDRAGYIGSLHASLLARDQRVRVAAVTDLLSDRVEILARSTGAKIAASVEELLDNVDAVYITTPNTKHTELALNCIDAGKHVFCEKPMATTLSDASAILDASDRSEKVFQVGHNRRFAPVYSTLKELIGTTGPAHSAHLKMNRGELLNPSWVADPEITGGFLFETTIHMFDMMRFLFGEVVSPRRSRIIARVSGGRRFFCVDTISEWHARYFGLVCRCRMDVPIRTRRGFLPPSYFYDSGNGEPNVQRGVGGKTLHTIDAAVVKGREVGLCAGGSGVH
jgi:predicted dehydrogenase